MAAVAAQPIGAIGRVWSAALLLHEGEVSSLDILKDFAASPHPEFPGLVRRVAAAVNEFQYDEGSTGKLVPFMSSSETDIRLAATNALGRSRSLQVIPFLVSALKDKNSDIRGQAAVGLCSKLPQCDDAAVDHYTVTNNYAALLDSLYKEYPVMRR